MAISRPCPAAQIDLHGLTCAEAKRKLERAIMSLPPGTPELLVIHGYHGGSNLADMVRRLRCRRVQRKLLTANPGETVYLLK